MLSHAPLNRFENADVKLMKVLSDPAKASEVQQAIRELVGPDALADFVAVAEQAPEILNRIGELSEAQRAAKEAAGILKERMATKTPGNESFRSGIWQNSIRAHNGKVHINLHVRFAGCRSLVRDLESFVQNVAKEYPDLNGVPFKVSEDAGSTLIGYDTKVWGD